MRVAWIYPRNKRCGISIYSQAYISHLKKHVTVEEYDISEVISLSSTTLKRINTCDCVHIQYETSFFVNKHFDAYSLLCAKLSPPIVVSLHEIYRQFPFDYPRDKIRGSGVIKSIKLWIYDRRHPFQTAYRNHLKRTFFGDTVLVHDTYQKMLLQQAGIGCDSIRVLEHPIRERKPAKLHMSKTPVMLGANGFITPAYDYELLFKTLDSLTIPWRFVWIGTAVKAAHQETLQKLMMMIKQRGWENRFTITGWVTDEKRDTLLDELSIYLALFKTRSSSGSLAAAFSARRPIIATDLPITRELNKGKPVLTIVESTSDQVHDAIMRMLSDKKMVARLLDTQRNLCGRISYRKSAQSLAEIYTSVVSS